MFSSRGSKTPPVIILGLGRFGLALGEELVHSGVEVLGVDSDENIVSAAAQVLTHVVTADTTNIEALKQLSVHEAQRVVIAIGSDMGASVLTASAVIDLGVSSVWAKADNNSHAKILNKIGVHHVVRPERDTGRRVAHLMSGRLEEYIEFARDFAMVKLAPPVSTIGKPIEQCPVSIVAIKPAEGVFSLPEPGTVLQPGDLVIAAGPVRELEKFGESD